MDTPTCHPLIIVTEEDSKKSRLLAGVDNLNTLNESLDTVLEWCEKQDHLKEACKYLHRTIVERLFLISKGSIEVTKQRLDKLLTSRGMMPELVMNRSIEEFDSLSDCMIYVPLPKICRIDQSRVMVTKFISDKIDDFTVLSYHRYGFMIGEYRCFFDNTVSERFIIDLNNISVNILTKLNPIVIKKAEFLCTEAFGVRVKGIHFLNAPAFVDKIIYIIKQTLKEKLANRIHVHSTYEDLHKHIPIEILPKDYGGEEASCSELAKRWKADLSSEKTKKIIKLTEKLVSDENYRRSFKFNEEYMGMPGSFKKLTVD